MASLFDRRLWALKPNVFLVLLAIGTMTKILKGEKKYFPLLAIPLGFSLNSDPSLGVVGLALVIAATAFKPKVDRKDILKGGVVLLLLLSPLIVFDLRHQGQNVKSLIMFTGLQIQTPDTARTRSGNFFLAQLNNFSRFLFPKSTSFADSYFCYCFLDDNPKIPTMIMGLILLGFGYLMLTTRKKEYLLLLIFLASYLIGIWGFREIL